MTRLGMTCVAMVLITTCARPAAPNETLLPPKTSTATSSTTVAVTRAAQPYEVNDCDTPPVTFSALCETYELLDEWYIDQPIDRDHLVDLALEGLAEFETDETAPRPRQLHCAIPTLDFEQLCIRLAERMAGSDLPVGPAIEAAVEAMVNGGLDPFTYYVPPEQAAALRDTGLVGGVGVFLDATNAAGSRCLRIAPSCPLEIVFVLEDNPGAAAGLESGDRIVAVDGQSVDGAAFASVASRLAGDETGVVTVRIERGGEQFEVAVERRELVVPTVSVELPFSDVGYLRIPDFDEDIPQLVNEGLEALTAARPGTIVVDVRDNPGGLLTSAGLVLSQFVESGTVFEVHDDGSSEGYEASGGGLATTPDLIVMVNQGTASAAEIFAATLRDLRGADVVGTNTFGKGVVQIPFELRNGGELFVVVARWRTPLGTTAADDGLSPDIGLEWPAAASIGDLVEMTLQAAR